jgi:hypothetical protein
MGRLLITGVQVKRELVMEITPQPLVVEREILEEVVAQGIAVVAREVASLALAALYG